MQLLDVLDQWTKDLDKGKPVDGMYMDLKNVLTWSHIIDYYIKAYGIMDN